MVCRARIFAAGESHFSVIEDHGLSCGSIGHFAVFAAVDDRQRAVVVNRMAVAAVGERFAVQIEREHAAIGDRDALLDSSAEADDGKGVVCKGFIPCDRRRERFGRIDRNNDFAVLLRVEIFRIFGERIIRADRGKAAAGKLRDVHVAAHIAARDARVCIAEHGVAPHKRAAVDRKVCPAVRIAVRNIDRQSGRRAVLNVCKRFLAQVFEHAVLDHHGAAAARIHAGFIRGIDDDRAAFDDNLTAARHCRDRYEVIARVLRVDRTVRARLDGEDAVRSRTQRDGVVRGEVPIHGQRVFAEVENNGLVFNDDALRDFRIAEQGDRFAVCRSGKRRLQIVIVGNNAVAFFNLNDRILLIGRKNVAVFVLGVPWGEVVRVDVKIEVAACDLDVLLLNGGSAVTADEIHLLARNRNVGIEKIDLDARPALLVEVAVIHDILRRGTRGFRLDFRIDNVDGYITVLKYKNTPHVNGRRILHGQRFQRGIILNDDLAARRTFPHIQRCPAGERAVIDGKSYGFRCPKSIPVLLLCEQTAASADIDYIPAGLTARKDSGDIATTGFRAVQRNVVQIESNAPVEQRDRRSRDGGTIVDLLRPEINRKVVDRQGVHCIVGIDNVHRPCRRIGRKRMSVAVNRQRFVFNVHPNAAFRFVTVSEVGFAVLGSVLQNVDRIAVLCSLKRIR